MTARQVEKRSPRYRPTVVASGYSTATGVGAGFSLAAIVLVFTLVDQHKPHYYLAFAASSFAVGTIGLLFCSFSYANLAGARPSQACFLHLMLNSSALTLCFLTELAGFEALARNFLPSTCILFIVVICGSVIVSPLWIWLVELDVIRGYVHSNKRQFETGTQVALFVARLIGASAVAIAVALLLRNGATPARTHSNRYIPLAWTLLASIGILAFAGVTISCRTDGVVRAPRLILWIVALGSLGLAGYLVALLP